MGFDINQKHQKKLTVLVPHMPVVGRSSNTADQYRSAPLQSPGNTSAGRVICDTNLAKCVSVPGYFFRPQGAFPPGVYPLREGLLLGAWGDPNKRNADGAVGIFGNAGPTKKRPCTIHTHWVGGHQIPQINIGVIRTVRHFLPFLCNSIFLVWYNLLSNICFCVFISDPFRGHNI